MALLWYSYLLFFFFHDPATTEIYTLSLTTLFRSVVVVAPIYGAREQPLPGVSAALVARGAVRAGATTVALRERATLTERVAETVQAGDVVFTLGAGDITRVGPELLARLGTGAGGAGA